MGPLLGSENKEAIDDYYIWDNDINFPGDDDPDTTVVIEGYNVPSGYNFVVGKGTVTVGAEGIEYTWGTGQLEHTLDSIIVYMP